MLQKIELFTAPFYVFSAIIPGIIFYRYLSRPYRIIFWYAVLSFMLNGTSIICSQVFRLRTTGFIHIFTILEFVCLSLYFANFYQGNKRKFIYGTAVIFVVLCILNTMLWQSPMIVNSYTRSAGAIILIAYCMIFFLRQNERDDTEEWSAQGLNWITAGLLLYYSCALSMFIFFNYLLVPSKIEMIIWAAHNIILLIEYILFAIGFSKCRSQQTTLTY